MTKRFNTHVTSDIALKHIRKIIKESGWTFEAAAIDHGEYLKIQNCCDCILNSFMISIQVKGIRNLKRYRSKKYGVSLILPADHILKWIRAEETVIVVLWDIEKRSGLWAIPNYEYGHGGVIIQKDNFARLLFPSQNKFNAPSLKRLIWKLKMSHYNLIVKGAFRDLENPELPGKFRQQIWAKINDIGYLFLDHIGIFDKSGIERDLVNYLRSLKEIIPENLLIQSALNLAILKKTGDRIGECLPFDLLKACVLAVESMANYKPNNI